MDSSTLQSNIGDKKVFLAVLAVIVLCAFDGMATVQHVSAGVASEANPAMQYLLSRGLMFFFFTKLAVTTGALLFCYAVRARTLGRLAIVLSIVSYYLLLLYHIVIYRVAYF